MTQPAQPTPQNFVGAAWPMTRIADDVNWLNSIPTTSPGLTNAERTRIASIKTRTAESRVQALCDALLAT